MYCNHDLVPVWCNYFRGDSPPKAVVVVSNKVTGSAGDIMFYQYAFTFTTNRQKDFTCFLWLP